MNLENKRPIALIVDDEKGIRLSMEGVLMDEGWEVVLADSAAEGIKKFLSHKPNLVFLDIWMKEMDGIEALQVMRQYRKDIPIVIMSGHGTIETAVKATKLGAYDFLEKPLSLDKIIPILEQIKDNLSKTDHLEGQGIGGTFIGESKSVQRIKEQILRVASKNVWVLITGENGTGKEVVANEIHANSLRKTYPFVAVNCAAIPDELIESELFGYVKGAFTNAIGNKKGKFEAAHKGTLFLDEIGDMSLRTQSKVLRILQEQRFEPLGSTSSIQVDVRVIAATNKNLEEEIKLGNFREDLYYRLNVIPFHLPALRTRDNDVILLAEYFLEQFSKELKETHKVLTADAKNMLLQYSWPGNVRELKNIVERLSIMVASSEISADDLALCLPNENKEGALSGSPIRTSLLAHSFKDAKIEFEKAYIVEKLKENGWNISKTAESIGIERSNLHKKIKNYDIEQ